jgi:hypothetical protein
MYIKGVADGVCGGSADRPDPLIAVAKTWIGRLVRTILPMTRIERAKFLRDFPILYIFGRLSSMITVGCSYWINPDVRAVPQ